MNTIQIGRWTCQLLAMIFACTSCAANDGVEMIQKPKISTPESLSEYINFVYDNSYIRWLVNVDGLPEDEAAARLAASLYPTEEALVAAVTADINQRFRKGESLEGVLQFFEASTKSIFGPSENLSSCGRTTSARGFEYDAAKQAGRRFGTHICIYVTAIPVPYSERIFDRIPQGDFGDREFPTQESWNEYQAAVRRPLTWEFRVIPGGPPHEEFAEIKFGFY